MDYKKFLNLTGMDLWDKVVSKADLKSLGKDFLDFAWQNKDKFDDSQLEYVCWLLGKSEIPNAEGFLREFIGHSAESVRMWAVLGLVNKRTLEQETLEKVLWTLINLTLYTQNMLRIFTPEREAGLMPEMKEELRRMREYFGGKDRT